MVNSEIVWNGSPFLCKTQHIRNEKLYATTITMSKFMIQGKGLTAVFHYTFLYHF